MATDTGIPSDVFRSTDGPWSLGANLAGSPIVATKAESNRLTVLLIPVGEWLDGTRDSAHGLSHPHRDSLFCRKEKGGRKRPPFVGLRFWACW